MSVRPRPRLRLSPASSAATLDAALAASGAATPERIARVREQARRRRQEARLADVLWLEAHIAETEIAKADARRLGTMLIDPLTRPPDPSLGLAADPARCARDGLLPWRRVGAATVILSARPEQFARHRAWLTALFGPVRMAVATETSLIQALQDHHRTTLAAAAETRTPKQESCRDWSLAHALRIGGGTLGLLIGMALLAPALVFGLLASLAVAALVFFTGLKALSALLFLRRGGRESGPAPIAAHLPTITVLVPLLREKQIAAHLLRHLRRLDYPRASLDILLVLEDDDTTTLETVAATRLPPWIRTLSVPAGSLRTKPRALNYALDFARGSIIGVYDAEDAPAPDQLRRVVARFAARGPEVACLQGVLDYYNASANWLSRCFAVEYATWFRMILPGLQRLGFAVPLGGTTLFFRRDALDALGGWDAHNVTEDADLGIRLARHGYRTELIETVTQEEANNRLWPWIKQRSRWLKGYAITYGVHMSRPRALWRDLGPKRFFGVQLLFLGTLLQISLAPVLWSFWLVVFGLPHPLDGILPTWAFLALGITLLVSEIIGLAASIIAVRAAGHGWLMKWVPTLPFYQPLAAIACWKAIVELAVRPFHWEKTAHGLWLDDTRSESRIAPVQA